MVSKEVRAILLRDRDLFKLLKSIVFVGFWVEGRVSAELIKKDGRGRLRKRLICESFATDSRI